MHGKGYQQVTVGTTVNQKPYICTNILVIYLLPILNIPFLSADCNILGIYDVKN